MAKKKLFIVVNVDWFFLSHRLPIALEALKRGYEVTVFAIEEGGHSKEIESYGMTFIPLPTNRSGVNLLKELYVLFFLWKHYRKGKPDVIHHVALKPVVYGSLASKFLGCPNVVNALSGMGYLFSNTEEKKITRKIVLNIFKYAFRNEKLKFILQNKDDLKIVIDSGVVKSEQCFIIKGSGVSLTKFSYTPEVEADKIRFLLPARMLWDKGVGEYVKAAKLLHDKYKDKAEFILAGFVDKGNKAGISEEQLLEWNKEGVVNWIGFQSNMVKIVQEAHVLVLPSYREGLPKSLIEACAIGRAIITTDVTGCRDVVEDGINGFVVPVRTVEPLADAMEKLILDKGLRIQMGKEGRKIAEKEFSIKYVLNHTFDIYNKSFFED